jgi:hypothetical protein
MTLHGRANRQDALERWHEEMKGRLEGIEDRVIRESRSIGSRLFSGASIHPGEALSPYGEVGLDPGGTEAFASVDPFPVAPPCFTERAALVSADLNRAPGSICGGRSGRCVAANIHLDSPVARRTPRTPRLARRRPVSGSIETGRRGPRNGPQRWCSESHRDCV